MADENQNERDEVRAQLEECQRDGLPDVRLLAALPGLYSFAAGGEMNCYGTRSIIKPLTKTKEAITLADEVLRLREENEQLDAAMNTSSTGWSACEDEVLRLRAELDAPCPMCARASRSC